MTCHVGEFIHSRFDRNFVCLTNLQDTHGHTDGANAAGSRVLEKLEKSVY